MYDTTESREHPQRHAETGRTIFGEHERNEVLRGHNHGQKSEPEYSNPRNKKHNDACTHHTKNGSPQWSPHHQRHEQITGRVHHPQNKLRPAPGRRNNTVRRNMGTARKMLLTSTVGFYSTRHRNRLIPIGKEQWTSDVK